MTQPCAPIFRQPSLKYQSPLFTLVLVTELSPVSSRCWCSGHPHVLDSRGGWIDMHHLLPIMKLVIFANIFLPVGWSRIGYLIELEQRLCGGFPQRSAMSPLLENNIPTRGHSSPLRRQVVVPKHIILLSSDHVHFALLHSPIHSVGVHQVPACA